MAYAAALARRAAVSALGRAGGHRARQPGRWHGRCATGSGWGTGMTVGMTPGKTLGPEVAALLADAGLDPADTERAVRVALDEDLAWGPDVTTAALPGAAAATMAAVVARQPGVLAGVP